MAEPVAERIPYGSAAARRRVADRVGRHLRAGGIVAYPTETVYGLGCSLHDPGLRRLAAFKGDRPFLLLIGGPEDAPALEWTPAAHRLAERFWPGPLTLALDARPGSYPPQVVGPDGAVAVRHSPHPGVADLLAASGGPVTSTSANAPGAPPARSAAGAAAVAGSIEGIIVLDGGELPPGPPSTIVRCGAGPVRILREGVIGRDAIQAHVEVE